MFLRDGGIRRTSNIVEGVFSIAAPELTITDDSGRAVSKERHLKAGSALKRDRVPEGIRHLDQRG